MVGFFVERSWDLVKFSYAMLALFLGSRSQSGNDNEKKTWEGRLCCLVMSWLCVGCLVVHYWFLVIGCCSFFLCCLLFFSTSEVPCDQRMASGLVRGEGGPQDVKIRGRVQRCKVVEDKNRKDYPLVN